MKWGLTKRNRESDSLLDVFHRDLNRVFDDFFEIRTSPMFDIDWTPSIDVVENETSINVKAEMPGMEEKDIRVTIENHVLTVSGEKKEESRKEDKDSRSVVSERLFGSFRRSIPLPAGINVDKIKASFKNGILRIDIPKEESVKTQRITIDVK